MSREEEEGKRKEVNKGQQTNEHLKMTCTSTSAHLLTASESDLAKLLRRRRRRRRSRYSQLVHINTRQYVTFSRIPHTPSHSLHESLRSSFFKSAWQEMWNVLTHLILQQCLTVAGSQRCTLLHIWGWRKKITNSEKLTSSAPNLCILALN